jgi:hypothetical protein
MSLTGDIQDDQLRHEVLTYGTNWATIAVSHVPRRPTLSLKNRYSTLHLRYENKTIGKTWNGPKTATVESLSSEPAIPPRNTPDWNTPKVHGRIAVDGNQEGTNGDGKDRQDEEDGDGKGIEPHRQAQSESVISANHSSLPSLGWASFVDQGDPFTSGSLYNSPSPALTDKWAGESATTPLSTSQLATMESVIHTGPEKGPVAKGTSVKCIEYGEIASITLSLYC